jgi:hypothetical protein
VRTYAITQLMSASLYSDDAMLDSMTKALIEGHVQQAGLVMLDEPRIAYSFGRFVHDRRHEFDDGDAHVCTEDCTTVPAEQDDADVVLMRVEFDVEGDEPVGLHRCTSCGVELDGDDSRKLCGECGDA